MTSSAQLGAALADRFRPDCSSCFGLCCVALPFAASADFAADKPGGVPCANLAGDDTCGIHDRLRSAGYRGCTVFDCLGAGQHTSRVVFRGTSWRTSPEVAASMFAVFPVVRQLFEILRYVCEAEQLPVDRPTYDGLAAARCELEALIVLPSDQLRGVVPEAVRSSVNALLLRASDAARSSSTGPREDLRGADLLGTDLRRRDLRGASLRGAVLVAADLRGADLALTDLTGADLRDADLRGADLCRALFLLPSQVASARGDATTSLPAGVERPGHWAA